MQKPFELFSGRNKTLTGMKGRSDEGGGGGGKWKEGILGYNNNSEMAFSRFLS